MTYLIDHRIDRVLQIQHFPSDLDRHFLGQVPFGDRFGNMSNVSDLIGEVSGHRVHVIRQFFPDAVRTLHFGLCAQLAFGADLMGYPRDFRSKEVELVD